jgi:SAM-dependent methyltransferase
MSSAVGVFSPVQGPTLNRMAGAVRYNRWLLDRAQPFLGTRVLDVGAGVGIFTRELADDREVVAIEPDPDLFPMLQRQLGDTRNVTVLHAGIEELREHDSFDTVVCFNVLEHISDHSSALARLADALKTGGRALLLVPAHPLLFGSLDRELHHERRYRKQDLRHLLRSNGFVLETLRHVNPAGAIGWFMSSRVFRRTELANRSLRVFDVLVPLLRPVESIPIPFGLSVWAVARRA